MRLVRFLPDLLALQRDLVKRLQNVSDLPCNTIGEFLNNQKAGTRALCSDTRANKRGDKARKVCLAQSLSVLVKSFTVARWPGTVSAPSLQRLLVIQSC